MRYGSLPTTMKRAVFPTLLLALAGLACKSSPERLVVRDGATLTLLVSGMACSECPAEIVAALETVPGVVGADVDYDKSTVVVSFLGKADLDAMHAALCKAGFAGAVREP